MEKVSSWANKTESLGLVWFGTDLPDAGKMVGNLPEKALQWFVYRMRDQTWWKIRPVDVTTAPGTVPARWAASRWQEYQYTWETANAAREAYQAGRHYP